MLINSSKILSSISTDQDQTFSITQLAAEFSVTTRTIRFYEDEGLLTPQRHGRNRVYTLRDRIRLRLILRGKRLGFTLKEVAEIINMYDSEPGECGQLRYFLSRIEERRNLLQQQQQDIEIILEDLDRIETQCHRQLEQLNR